MKPVFLIVEDEPITARFIREIIEDQGYEVAGIAKSAADARELIAGHRIDLIFMDINIHGNQDGIQLTRSLGKEGIGVIYMSAYCDQQTLCEAAETLPYGFMVKPFKEADIVAVLLIAVSKFKQEALLKENSDNGEKQFGEYRLDFKNNCVHRHTQQIHLSKNEMCALELFFGKPESVIPLEELRRSVWGERDIGNSTIRELINRIRNKVEGLSIKNVYGTGYMLKV